MAPKRQSSKTPIIGITLDAQEPGGYSSLPWYALRKDYASAVAQAGGIPLHIPHEAERIKEYIALVDGMVFPGGDHDIDPALYGAATRHEKVVINNARAQFEFDLFKAALDKDIPILGICAGQQLMNVVFGGTLIQHIPDEVPNFLDHDPRKKGAPQGDLAHDIEITEGTLLFTLSGGMKKQRVNSSHHQAVKTVGKNVVINAVATDGVIEGIEVKGHKFCLGVEWHPEYLNTDFDRAIFKALIKAAHA